jgi:hypothetical protein
MAKTGQTLIALQKLYDKRAVLDKQIITAEKKLVAESEKAQKAAPAKPARTPAAKKTVTRKPRTKKSADLM